MVSFADRRRALAGGGEILSGRFLGYLQPRGSVFDPGGANDLFLQHAATGETGIVGVATQEAKLVMAIAGGVLTLAMGVYHIFKRKKERIAVPYGVAIAFGALWVLYPRLISIPAFA